MDEEHMRFERETRLRIEQYLDRPSGFRVDERILRGMLSQINARIAAAIPQGPEYPDTPVVGDGELEEVPPVFEPSCWSVDVYLVRQCYGGPEEGGWWYDSGVRCRDVAVMGLLDAEDVMPSTHYGADSARHHWRRMQDVLDEKMNKDRPPLHSVLSRGVFWACVHPEVSPASWPAERPVYK